MDSSKIMEYIKKDDFRNFTKDDFIKAIKDLTLRLTLATDFTQCEMDERVLCTVCDYYFVDDYCPNNKNGLSICDVCSAE